jgi:rubrerythrin
MSAQKSENTQGNASNSQGNTGTRDITYDLVSVIYHSLQGAETTAMFVSDAEQEGNQELAQFFRECKEEQQARADRAKQLLTTHLGKTQGKGAAGGQP